MRNYYQDSTTKQCRNKKIFEISVTIGNAKHNIENLLQVCFN